MAKDIQLITHGHPYVEIGGVKWATMNVGATKPDEVGQYFAWGDTKGYYNVKANSFTEKTYKFYGLNGMALKYNDKDKLKSLKPEDDPVHANWRGDWRLPTDKEISSLIAACAHVYRAENVMVLVSKDGQELLFPLSGHCVEGMLLRHTGSCYLWSSSLDDYDGRLAKFFQLYSYHEPEIGFCRRVFGFNVRGVLARD